ncbi:MULTISPECIES: GH92 family glycosyl hydrolase [unclassified Arenibacter]|uniref:GH92 family glycosyl hydrolase n=1 Tax=unclassified Arenibacter TaxID=2615047 RepID=UPI000E34094E|nr:MULTISPECIES: GH92 family glycosyl hydrolase [unclassified Arenibacter]MCM4163002.1 glycoside hydrolase family 92 protein [Arenibacter sp. A80]RFT57041.1 glycoside hydrolase family 92 protein [Arenibacter sp. P308M17]
MKLDQVSLYLLLLLTISSFYSCQETSPPQNPRSTNVVDLVYPHLDSENSRWFFFSSASRPFGMVNLSPDTAIEGAWGSGYRYKTDTIKGFSHVHGWQISGLSVMPVSVGPENETTIYKDFYSKFNHEQEKVSPGYHHIELLRQGISVELSSTKRVGFHKYSFPKKGSPAILFNLNTLLGPNENINGILEKTGNTTLSGELEMTPTMRRPKPFKLFFKIELNSDIRAISHDPETGNYLVYTDEKNRNVLMKASISYTSAENARINMDSELNHWDFQKVVDESKEEWNGFLGRIKIEGGSETQQRRFYTDLWHALQGRRVISDFNGAYPDNTGDNFRIGQIPLDATGQPKFNHYNSDSFWGAQWTINTLWGLVYPDIMEDFTHSLMQYYKDGGLVPRGPSGGNYTYVMTGASSTPFIVSAIQKGIIKQDLESIYGALKKNHMPGGIMEKAGYEHKTALGGGFKYYLNDGYVPYPVPEGKFGGHQDGASLTMEYAYQDWTLAQLAKKLGHKEDYELFLQRSYNYKNVFDKSLGWMRPKDVAGTWQEDFDPYVHQHGFIESNGAQSTWFVPHDINGLADLMGGRPKAVEKLNAQFEAAEKLGFTAGSSHSQELHPEYRRIPINYGNQPSIQTAFVFNLLDRPDLTQYWSRKIVDKVFGGLSPSTGYNGDEDQGLMGSLAVLMKIGLFQMNGGTENDPVYELGSPVFDKIEISLHPDYYTGKKFTIKANRKGMDQWAVKEARLNNKAINDYTLRHSQLVKGGELELDMGE